MSRITLIIEFVDLEFISIPGAYGMQRFPFRNQAFQAAKKFNNIPRSAQPVKTYKVPDRGPNAGKQLTVYDYVNNNGQRISIRKDLPRKYGGDGRGDQGHHYNAGSSGGKLKQHYYFDKHNSKKG